MLVTHLLPWVVFVACVCIAWLALDFLAGKSATGGDRLDQRLEKLRTSDGDRYSSREPESEDHVQKLSYHLARLLEPKSVSERQALRVRLANAGYHAPHARAMFLAIKIVAAVAGGLLGAGSGLAIWGFSRNGLMAPVLIAGLGFYLPDMCLAYLVSARQDRLFRTLPNALDMLVCCIEVGQSLDAAICRVAQQIDDTAPDLCAEFNLYTLHMQMGRPRAEALHDLAVRAGIDDLNTLTSVLIQADRFGSSIAKSLRELSDSMRVKRRHLAEERAQKTAVKLVFPLVLFIFPGIFVVLVGPAAILMITDMLRVK